MITITKTPNADSRTATGPEAIEKEVLLINSKMHIEHVKQGFRFIIAMMEEAAKNHDWTKIEYIDDFFKDFTSGSTGKDFKSKKWFQTHCTKERHHWLDNCPDNINLIDVMEKCVDVTMAGLSRSGEIYDEKIPDEILQKAYKNTIELIKRNTTVID